MNEEAEKWIAKMLDLALTANGDLDEDLSQLLREAVRWAYADAARVCREMAIEDGGMKIYSPVDCEMAIEGRSALPADGRG